MFPLVELVESRHRMPRLYASALFQAKPEASRPSPFRDFEALPKNFEVDKTNRFRPECGSQALFKGRIAFSPCMACSSRLRFRSDSDIENHGVE